MDTGMVLEAPLPPLSAKMRRMSRERHHKLESTSVGTRPLPPPFRLPGSTLGRAPPGLPSPPMPRTGTYHNLIRLGVPIPGLARNPCSSFRDRGGGSLAMVGPSLPRSPHGEHCIQVRRFLLGAIDWALAQSMPQQLGAAGWPSGQLKPTSSPESILPG